MSLLRTSGPHFDDPKLFLPQAVAVGSISTQDAASSNADASTTAFFTEMATRWAQDTTNWTANTYKTILSVSGASGLVAGLVGCTAGGAETTTFEITRDGVLSELTVTVASGERAILSSGTGLVTHFTNAATSNWVASLGALNAGKTTIGTRAGQFVPPWSWLQLIGTPCLRFRSSLLVRAKHSASITNSTATAYSAVMYRLGIAA